MKTAATRRNNFNLLRLILALLVILSHSPELIDGDRHREILTQIFGTISFGELAVECFFLLSGYLILQSWCLNPQVWPYLKKRVLRIYPAFLVASIICAVVVGPLAASPSQYFSDFNIPAYVTSAFLIQKPAIPEVFRGMHYPAVNNAMWSVSREFACYLFVLAFGFCGLLRRRYTWLLLTIAIFSLYAWLKLRNIDAGEIRLAVFFSVGGCFYLYRDMIRLNGWIALALLLPLAIGMKSWRGSEIALATLGAYVILFAAFKHSDLLSRFNDLPDISYGVYLYGWPSQMLLLWYIPTISPWTLFVTASGISIAMGYFSWHLVEKPMLRLKDSSKSRVESLSAAAATLADVKAQ